MALEYKDIPGEVQWFINDKCNYDCSYCFVNRDNVELEMVKNYQAFIEQFNKVVPENWNFFLIGGGEPFIHPDFIRITKGLIESGYTISVNTNFSSPIESLIDFFNITQDRLVWFIASLHLESTDPGEFIKKITTIRKKFPKFKNFFVKCVALPERMSDYMGIAELFRNNKIFFELQPYRDKNHNHFSYSESQLAVIRSINQAPNQNRSMRKYMNTKGQICNCGFKYIIINPSGEIFRCVPAMRSKNPMGNILEANFELFKKAEICIEQKCFCFEKYKSFFPQTMPY